MPDRDRSRERTGLYRLYDEEGVLLYVGISNSPKWRWKDHAAGAPWWPHVHRKEVEWFDGRPEAEAAEDRAMLTEHPLFNTALPAGHRAGGRRPSSAAREYLDRHGSREPGYWAALP